MTDDILIAPSILSADFGRLDVEVAQIGKGLRRLGNTLDA